MKEVRRIIKLFLCLFIVLFLLSGCATTANYRFGGPLSGPISKINIEVTSFDDSKFPYWRAHMVSGGYRIPNSSFFAIKYTPLLLQALSPIVAAAVRKNQNKKTVGDADIISASINITEEVRNIIDTHYKNQQSILFENQGREIIVKVVPYVTIESIEEKVIIRTVLAIYSTNKSGKVNWINKYVYRIPDKYPLYGDNSWTTNNAVLLKTALREGYIMTLKQLFYDIAHYDEIKKYNVFSFEALEHT